MHQTPIIITVALLGAELTREQTPYLPLTSEELAQSALECYQAGAAMVHVHVRDDLGNPTLNPNKIMEVLTKIKTVVPGLILQLSTGGSVQDSYIDRIQVLHCQPEMASLTTGSTNFGNDIFLNPRPFVEELARQMLAKKIKSELEIFNLAMMEEALRLIDVGLVKSPAHFDFVLGVPGALAASEKNLDILLERLPQDATFTVAAIGKHQFPMLELAIQKGGHVRLGMEDNIYLEKGVLAKSNAELVNKVQVLIKQHGRCSASPQEARTILGL